MTKIENQTTVTFTVETTKLPSGAIGFSEKKEKAINVSILWSI